MTTFAQGTDNDLVLTAGKRLQLVTDRAQAGAIKLGNRLRFFLGEWFLDTRLGVPYYQIVYVKNPDMGVIRRLFRSVALATSPIVSVDALDLSLDRPTRKLSISNFRGTCDNGQVIVGGAGEPFIVEGTVKPS